MIDGQRYVEDEFGKTHRTASAMQMSYIIRETCLFPVGTLAPVGMTAYNGPRKQV